MKKGQMNSSSGVLVKLLVTLLVFFVVLTLVVKVYYSSTDDKNAERQKCKISALALSKLGKNLGKEESYASFDCNTLIYSSEEVPEDEFELKSFLADEMYSCWGIFGEGKLGSVFADKNFYWSVWRPEINVLVADKCFVCSEIDPPKNGFVVDDFVGFLKNNNPPVRDESYYKILYGDVSLDNNRFLSYKKNDEKGYFQIVDGLNNYNKPLYVVYSEGKNFQGVGLYTQEELFGNDKIDPVVCKGVFFGK